MNKTIALIALLLFAGTALAQPMGADEMKSLYNSNIGMVPDYVQSVIGNENLHVIFTLDSGMMVQFAAVTRDGMIAEAEAWQDRDADGNHDPWQERGLSTTMKLRSNEETMNSITSSPNPMASLKQAWGKSILFEPVSMGAHVKMFIANIGMFISGFFI